jgi:hypothetical protein
MNADASNLLKQKKGFISNALEYACKFFADHLHMTTINDKLLKIVSSLTEFFQRDSLVGGFGQHN